MAVVLYDQFGRPITREKRPERRPLAVAPLLDSMRDYVTDGLTPERLAAVFREADQGDIGRQAELFEQLEEKDGHLLCERDKRKNVILNLDFDVEPASDDARDLKVADFIRDFFANHADWADCLTALQDAVGKGFAALEPIWDNSEGGSLPEKFTFIEQKRFRFTDRRGVLRGYPLLVTDTDAMGVEIPAWKLILHRYGGKSGHSARAGIYRVCAWMILFKHYSIKDWVVFCEVYGMPLRLGKYDQGATDEDKAALIAAISSLGSDAAGIISRNTEIDFIETVSKGTGDMYRALADFCNSEISKAILGQTLTAEVGGKGSYAAAKTHDGIRLDLLKADGRALAATIRDQLVRPMVGFNFGWDTELPKFNAVFTEPEDENRKAERFEKITERIQVGEKWARKFFDIPEPEEGEKLVGGDQKKVFKYHLDYGILTINEIREGLGMEPIADGDRIPEPLFDTGGESRVQAKLIAASGRPAGFTPEQQAVEDLADMAVAGTDLAANEEKILEAVRSASSYEEAMENLLELYPDLDMSSMRDMLERVILNSELYGRMVVGNGRQT